MNITTLKKVLLPILESKLTPWIWGYHGKGKSETVETIYKDLGWLIFNFRLNTQADVGDFLGLQDFVKDSKTGKSIATAFCMPEWLKNAIDFCLANPDKRACIFIDEINRAATTDLIGPVFQMSLDRRLHTFIFPDNLDVIVASNPNTSDYAVLNLDDKALLSRFWHVYFNPTKAEWFAYATAKEFDSSIPGFIEENPEFLEEQNLEGFSVSDFAKPDRRKWTLIDRLLKRNFLTVEEQGEVLSGLIGVAPAIAFEKYLEKMDKPVTLEEVLESYPSVRDRILKAANQSKTRTDILHNVAEKVKDYFKDDPAITELHGSNVVSFIKDLPNDLMFGVMHAIYRKRKFHDFCENKYEKLNMVELEKRLEVIRRTVLPESLVKNG
jgi:hypothetical protein